MSDLYITTGKRSQYQQRQHLAVSPNAISRRIREAEMFTRRILSGSDGTMVSVGCWVALHQDARQVGKGQVSPLHCTPNSACTKQKWSCIKETNGYASHHPCIHQAVGTIYVIPQAPMPVTTKRYPVFQPIRQSLSLGPIYDLPCTLSTSFDVPNACKLRHDIKHERGKTISRFSSATPVHIISSQGEPDPGTRGPIRVSTGS